MPKWTIADIPSQEPVGNHVLPSLPALVKNIFGTSFRNVESLRILDLLA
jgi:hypothetical protein